MSISQDYRDGGGYYAACRPRRSKIDWAGVGPGDAFKNNREYHVRMPAQRLFYQLAHKVQRAVAEHTGAAPEAYELKVKPQLSPLMTSYPSTLAAHAAIGHTAYLEFEARVPEKLLFTQLAKYLENPAERDDLRVDPKSYKEVAKVITKQVQVRLLLEDLARYPFGISVEIYRLFSASQQNDKFRSVAGMLQAVILYGDILPDWREQDLHPMTRIMLGYLTRTCIPFFDKLPHTPPQGLVHLGADWVRALCLCLPVADYSQVIFRRYRIREKADPRGKPVVLIACDGSGSLNHKQMQMLKLLAAAWLESTAKSEIQVLAGLYHSGVIRLGVSGPLVQWIYHPQKTPALTRKEAARALVALPPSGTGAQADALSLAFMLGQARQLSRGRMIYLILLSDCAWNPSFRTGKTGKEEVYAFFETAYPDHPGKLNTTLVALGVAGATGFEALLDKVVAVNEEQLLDPAAVAGRIGTYVASCLKERRRWVKKQ
jgi:hypothetical protein